MENELTVEDLNHIIRLLNSEKSLYENNPRIPRSEDRFRLIDQVDDVIKKVEALKKNLQT